MTRSLLLVVTILLAASVMLFVSCGDEDSPTDTTPPAASLSVQPTQLDFGTGLTELALTVTNSGSGTLTWACGCGAAYVSYQPSEGSIATDNHVDTISVSVNREGLTPGDYADTLAISSNGGTVRVPVSLAVGLAPPPSVLGDYQGIYVYITDFGSVNEHPIEFPILWRFTDHSYYMWNAPGSEDALCEPSGEYVLSLGVELSQEEAGCSSEISDPDMNPTGIFTFRQQEDSLIMIQIVGDVRKDIRLGPASE